MNVEKLIDLGDQGFKKLCILNNLPVLLPVHLYIEIGAQDLESEAMDCLDRHRLAPFMELLLYLFPDAGIESTVEDIIDVGNVLNAFHQSGGLTASWGGHQIQKIYSPIFQFFAQIASIFVIIGKDAFLDFNDFNLIHRATNVGIKL